MFLVLRKTFVMRPPDGNQWPWRFAAEYDSEPTDEQLKQLGEGELKVIEVDPDKKAHRHVENTEHKPSVALKDLT